MPRRRLYVFKFDAYSPATFPMGRLADYLADLSTLLGEQKSVHFQALKKGSTAIVYTVDDEAEPKIRERMRAVRYKSASVEAIRAARRIDEKLAEDNATGRIVGPTGTKVLEFPGRRRFTQPVYGPFNQPDSVDGIPILVGGQHDPVPVHLQETPGQEPHYCLARREIARAIGTYLFTTMIRAQGVGRWTRHADGQWIRSSFMIHTFQSIEDAPLTEVVARLRTIPSDLHDIEDPLSELEDIRYGDSD